MCAPYKHTLIIIATLAIHTNGLRTVRHPEVNLWSNSACLSNLRDLAFVFFTPPGSHEGREDVLNEVGGGGEEPPDVGNIILPICGNPSREERGSGNSHGSWRL